MLVIRTNQRREAEAATIREARAVLDEMKEEGVAPAPWQEFALNQPELDGILREYGGLVTFDANGNPVWAQTVKIVDYSTQSIHEPRVLTREDLVPHEINLRDRLNQLMPNWSGDDMTIPIVSQSFRLAIAKGTIGRADSVYAIERGSGTRDEELIVWRIDPKTRQRRIVASDALFAK